MWRQKLAQSCMALSEPYKSAVQRRRSLCDDNEATDFMADRLAELQGSIRALTTAAAQHR